MKRVNKILLIFLVLIIIGVGGFLIYHFTRKSDNGLGPGWTEDQFNELVNKEVNKPACSKDDTDSKDCNPIITLLSDKGRALAECSLRLLSQKYTYQQVSAPSFNPNYQDQKDILNKCAGTKGNWKEYIKQGLIKSVVNMGAGNSTECAQCFVNGLEQQFDFADLISPTKTMSGVIGKIAVNCKCDI